MKKYNIWIVKIGEKPDKTGTECIRNYILSRELSKRGHHVTYFLSGFDHYKKKFTIEDRKEIKVSKNFRIITINGIGYKKNVSARRFFDHWIIAKKFSYRARGFSKPDLILASMPSHDLTYEVAKYASSRNIPFVVDIRDAWPDFFLEVCHKLIRWPVRVLVGLENRKLRYALEKASGIVSMNKDMLHWALNKVDRDKINHDRIFHLGSEPLNLDTTKRGSDFTLIYIGSFGYNSDPRILIQAARVLTDVKFILVGSGELYKETKKLSEGLENVELTGWVQKDKMLPFLERAHAGVLPTSVENTSDLPNKTFSYLSAGLPIISSYKGELAELIEEHKIGLNYKNNSSQSLVGKIRDLKNNDEMYRKYSTNAKNIFYKHFNSENIYKDFSDYLENFLK